MRKPARSKTCNRWCLLNKRLKILKLRLTHVVSNVAGVSQVDSESFDGAADAKANQREVQRRKLVGVVVEDVERGQRPGDAGVEVEKQENLVRQLQLIIRFLDPHSCHLFTLKTVANGNRE